MIFRSIVRQLEAEAVQITSPMIMVVRKGGSVQWLEFLNSLTFSSPQITKNESDLFTKNETSVIRSEGKNLLKYFFLFPVLTHFAIKHFKRYFTKLCFV